MSIETMQGMADTIAELEQTIDFICGQIAECFGAPCIYLPMDEIMCIKDCGNVPKSECWKKYFEEMQRRADMQEKIYAVRTEKELKPCPFCGGNKVELRSDDGGTSWYVFCCDCAVMCGYAMTKEDAIDVWNRRPESEG